LKQRIGIAPAGFRTPGGFNDGLTDRPDLQSMLQKMGYKWVGSRYPAHALGTVGRPPDRKVISAIVAAQAQAQPFMQWLTKRIVPREIDRNEALKCQTSSRNLVY
jgi:hypothetical protein